MQLDHSGIVLLGSCFAGALCGWMARHLWGLQADRAHADRMSELCAQLDTKDTKLHGIRAELQAEQGRVQELQGVLAARIAVGAPADWVTASPGVQPILSDPALPLEDNEDLEFFRRHIFALANKLAA